MSYAEPSTPTGIEWGDHNGALLLIQPLEKIDEIATKFGPSSAVRANVAVLDGESKGITYEDTLIFPKVLRSSVEQYVGTGKKVLGRLGKGVAKPGQSAPWTLTPATKEDAEIADKYLAHVAAKAVTPADDF